MVEQATRKERIPRLCHTTARGIGYYATYRDPDTDTPRKHIFGDVPKGEAEREYAIWLGQYMQGKYVPTSRKKKRSPMRRSARRVTPPRPVKQHSIVTVADEFLTNVIDARERVDTTADRRRGTIAPHTANTQRHQVKDFLAFLNRQHGHGVVAKIRIDELSMADVEQYNRWLVEEKEYSASEVRKRMQIVKRLIDRAGRTEHGQQVLSWNWESKDQFHGRPGQSRKLPSLEQLKVVLDSCDSRERAIIWMAIGLGFGPTDLATVRVEQIDAEGYDLRRKKTGLERYGETPLGVWMAISRYLDSNYRERGSLLFETRNGFPLVHGKTNTISLWWGKLRTQLGESSKMLGGFYVLRHLGATEYGSRAGISVGEVKRWLGHSSSSQVADRYMRPVKPEHRELIEWVRGQLQSEDV